MLKLVTDSKQVQKLYSALRKTLNSKSNFPELLKDFPLGHQGGGVGEARVKYFALDEAGNPVVVHRGHIGGGRPGIGLNLMLANCRSARATLIEDEGQSAECFVVGQLHSEFFIDQLADFVKEVKRVKGLTAHPSLSAPAGTVDSLFQLDNQKFSGEKSGTSTRHYDGTVERTHGLVVNALAEQLSSMAAKRAWVVSNDRHRDLMLMEGGDLKVLFEIKTTVTTQSICTGLGQLLLYSAAALDAALLLVLPEKLPSGVVHQLKVKGVHVLHYDWQGKQPIFPTLAKLLATIK